MYEYALEILKIINSNGYEAYIVGGYPRDKYLNIESIDIDICTSASPSVLKDIFKNDIIGNSTYFSLRLKKDSYIYQITTFRKDGIYLDARHPSNLEYAHNLKEDLLRRDFIINTLCIDASGKFIDVMGAKEDIENKIIRCVGNADSKIRNDILRLLRAIRFACVLDFKFDDELKEAIIKNKGLLNKLSLDRKKQELDKIFKSKNKKVGIDLILKYELENLLDIKGLDNIVLTDSYLGIWAQLECDKYNFTRVEKRTIKLIRRLVSDSNLSDEILTKYDSKIVDIAREIIDKKTRK